MVPAVVVGIVAVLILAVNIGTPTIFTAVTAVAVIMIYVAYLLVTVPMLVKRLRGQWPDAEARQGAYFSLGLAWPRAEVYGEGVLSWIAFLFIGAVVLLGLTWYHVRGKHHLGTLPEHMAQRMEGAPDGGNA